VVIRESVSQKIPGKRPRQRFGQATTADDSSSKLPKTQETTLLNWRQRRRCSSRHRTLHDGYLTIRDVGRPVQSAGGMTLVSLNQKPRRLPAGV
jgi:hypothetical protein